MADKSLQERADELTGENKQLKARVTELEGLVASGAQAAESEKVKDLQTKLDEANGKISAFEQALEKRADERSTLRIEAARHLGPQVRIDGMTDRQVHEAVVKRLDASADVKAPSDAELRGQYNALIASAARNVASQNAIAEILGRTTAEAQRADEGESYDSSFKNAWKTTPQKNGRAAAGGR